MGVVLIYHHMNLLDLRFIYQGGQSGYDKAIDGILGCERPRYMISLDVSSLLLITILCTGWL